jgi:hypothetical protein
MNKQLPPEHQELYGRVGEVLHHFWDLIGVAGFPQARDEYDSYVPQVFSLLVSHKPAPMDSLLFSTTRRRKPWD